MDRPYKGPVARGCALFDQHAPGWRSRMPATFNIGNPLDDPAYHALGQGKLADLGILGREPLYRYGLNLELGTSTRENWVELQREWERQVQNPEPLLPDPAV